MSEAAGARLQLFPCAPRVTVMGVMANRLDVIQCKLHALRYIIKHNTAAAC